MDDVFIGRFIFIWNLLFLAIIHSTRYWLGSMHESLEFQLLSGIKVSYQNVFWPIFIKTLFVIAGISVAGIACKIIYTHTWAEDQEAYKQRDLLLAVWKSRPRTDQ